MKGKYVQGVYFPPRFKPEDWGFEKCESKGDSLYQRWINRKSISNLKCNYYIESVYDPPHSPYYILSSEYECVSGGTSTETLYQGAITPSFAKSLFRLYKYRNFNHFK